MINFRKSTYLQCEDLFQKYLLSLSNDYDNYLEDHILDSDFYLYYTNKVKTCPRNIPTSPRNL